LAAILNNKHWPVQLLFAGKAHPHDSDGKKVIAEVLHMARRPELRPRVVFLEDYDMNITRQMIQGVDVWLNNPRRPLEASGTSGMKVCVNGGINLSILDGWWDEGYRGDNGWRIGSGEEFSDQHYQDEGESNALYGLIEREIVPEFYTRRADGQPPAEPLRIGDELTSSARVHLGSPSADDVEVQLYHGNIDSFGEIASPSATLLRPVAPPGANGSAVFGAAVPCAASGQYGFSVR